MAILADSDRGLMSELERLVSEERNLNTMGIDLLPTGEILRAINDEDKLAPAAVEKVIPEITLAVDRIVDALGRGGRLVYMGAGTSGRLGVLDAAECPPTFGVPADMVVGLMAGGADALAKAAEGAEDDAEEGVAALDEIGLTSQDVVVGIAVSGRTPYVVGGLTHAKALGATTIALSCNRESTIARIADIAISPVVGPEVLTGSTRLKSGTAQKLVLNMLTTASMIRMGKCYENLMVDLHPTNMKLLARAARIVIQATHCTVQQAEDALERTDNDVKLAILVVVTGMTVRDARSALRRAGGFLRKAIDTHARGKAISLTQPLR
jgi:N-acetylmuramic acid 6-phosphate etherase